jgi:hypothetical protein
MSIKFAFLLSFPSLSLSFHTKQFKILKYILDHWRTDHSPLDLRRGSWLLEHWERGFESHSWRDAYFCDVLSGVGRGHRTVPVQGFLRNVEKSFQKLSENFSECPCGGGSSSSSRSSSSSSTSSGSVDTTKISSESAYVWINAGLLLLWSVPMCLTACFEVPYPLFSGGKECNCVPESFSKQKLKKCCLV